MSAKKLNRCPPFPFFCFFFFLFVSPQHKHSLQHPPPTPSSNRPPKRHAVLISRNTTFVPGTVSLFDSVAVVAQCHHPTRWLDGIALTRSPTPPYSFAIQHYFLHQATILSPLLARFPKSALCLVKNEFTHPPKHNKPQTKRRQSMTARGGASCEVACGAVAGPVPAPRLLQVHRCIRRTAVLMGVRC